MLSGQTMAQHLIQLLIFTICGLAAFGLSKLLRCRLAPFACAPTTGHAWRSLVPVAITVAGFVALGLWAPPGQQDVRSGLLVLTFWQGVGFLIYVLPAGWAMLRRREPLSSAGLRRHNLWQACVIGLVVGALWCAAGTPGHKLVRLLQGGWSLSLVFLALFGFAEEFLYRGYLQIRLISQLGVWRGWPLVSLIFAASHFPHRLIYEGLHPGQAVIGTMLVLPIALALGFVMLRTQNILAPAIFHTIINF
jgi:membrane protease YdiL (CAAX protease family)